MSLSCALALISITSCIPINALQAQELSAAEVRRSIERGKKFLLDSQQPNGSWRAVTDRHAEGATALATLALLNAGISPKSEPIQKALDQLLALPEIKLSTYVASIRLMVLAIADPKSYAVEIQNDVDWLVGNQIKQGPSRGGWSYPQGSGDASNSQYALLALHEANNAGADIPLDVWKMARDYWENCFDGRSGGFGYTVSGHRVNGSMTCAGVSSLIICLENLEDQDIPVRRGKVLCCQTNSKSRYIDSAMEWMARRFSVRGNPPNGSLIAKFYYLYGMERVGRLSGRRFIGDHDWYREGARELLRKQRANGSWRGAASFLESQGTIATSFALLFLSKGKRPIVMGKYKSGVGDDWDRHPKGVHYLTRELEKQWDTKLNWQTINGNEASIQDLVETPVLFISGRDQLDLTSAQKRTLKEYVENGNFIFAEANQGNGCGNNVAFDRKFRALMLELFPDSQLTPLARNHPIWNAHFEIKPSEDWPILGLQACCRTSVVYVPRSLSGHWQLNREAALKKVASTAADQIKQARELGVNVISYATGRQLRDKLDTPQINSGLVSVLNNRALVLPKLDHKGGSDDAPNAWRNVLLRASEIGLTIDLEKKLISPVPEQLFDHPFVFMHGRNTFFFKNAEIEALTNYLKGGNRGFIFADAICSAPAFQKAFEKEIVRAVPDAKLKPIPANHPIWTDKFGGYNIKSVTITKPDRNKRGGFARRTVAPQFQGIEINGKWVVVYSPLDLSCALENATVSHCEGYARNDAIKLAINILLYSLQSE